MKFSNRKSDESVDKRVQFLLDSIYEKEGFRCKRPNDEKIDKRGVDIMLHSPNTDSILWVDEKCATHYWDRNLDTFSCELTCNRTMPWGREGDDLDTKYMYVCHSELNAILNAGKDLHGSTMYVTLFPCNECAKAIIQSGIKRIVYLDDKYRDANNNVAARHMFKITGVETKKYEPSARNISLNL